MREIRVGEYLRKKKILDLVQLSNGWYVIKTEDSKSARDFKVKTIFQTTPRIRSLTPKHAHFVIDFYGKLCANKEKAMEVFEAIVEIWNKKPVQDIVNRHQNFVNELPGYKLEYILHTILPYPIGFSNKKTLTLLEDLIIDSRRLTTFFESAV